VFLESITSPNQLRPAVRMRTNLCQPRSRSSWRRLVECDECAEVLHEQIEFRRPMCALLPMNSDELSARNVLEVRTPVVTFGEQPPKCPLIAEVNEDVCVASCPIS
jgi:hypothetical protein